MQMHSGQNQQKLKAKSLNGCFLAKDGISVKGGLRLAQSRIIARMHPLDKTEQQRPFQMRMQ
jgi:hypothetical protein